MMLALLLSILGSAQNPTIGTAAAKLLPDRLGDFRATEPLTLSVSADQQTGRGPGSNSWATRLYKSKDGQPFSISVGTIDSESGAYASFTERRWQVEADGIKNIVNDVGVGTDSFSFSDGKKNHICFFKGFVSATVSEYANANPQLLIGLAKTLAETIDKGEGEIPALVKHLPGWENGDLHAVYSVSLLSLLYHIPHQQIFDAISFEGGVTAAMANYGASQLLIVEFNTPQLATDNDRKIVAKIQELRAQGQPAPTGYRRVGNYAVFVFNAPDEQAANQLIDQVKYQQVVQWLGENPFSYEKATREFTETTLGVLVAVVKTSGLALLACLAVGGFLGALLFRFRRAQQRAREAYADSEAMLRLNLDELTPENDTSRLLGRGN